MKAHFLGAVAGTVAMLGALGVQADEIIGRLSYHWGPKHPSAIQASKFAENVNARLAGKFKIEVYPAGQLFGIREVMGAIASGAVDMGGVVSTVSFPSINRNYTVSVFPGYFESFQQQRDFFAKDPVGQKVWNDILTRTRSMVLAFNPVGPTAIYSKAPKLENAESLQGKAARVLSDPDRARWQAFGVGKMVSMPTREVYTGLQNGTIDTVATVPGALTAYSWWEHLKSAQLPYMYYVDSYIMANKPWFDGLPDDVKAVLTEEGMRTSEESTASIMAASNAIHEDFVANHGGHITTLSGDELAKVRQIERDKVEPLLAEEVDAEVFAALKKFVGRE